MDLTNMDPGMRRGFFRNGTPRTPRARPINYPIKTPLELRQQKIRDELNQLADPNVIDSHTATPEQTKILNDNMRRLLSAILPSMPTAKDESDSDHYELPKTPSRASARTTPYQTPGQGGKRQRSPEEETEEQTEEDSVDETPGAASEVDPDPQTPETQRKIKRLKTGTQVGLQGPTPCLSQLKPQPLQFDFLPHPDEDRTDAWYAKEFHKLFKRIDEFSQDYFGLHDLDEGQFHQPWAAGMAPEFLSYVEMVATADPGMDGWDKLLRDTKQRQWLIMAVLMRIIEVKIFGTDLWGADVEEKKLLFGIERAFLNREGFARTALRSQTVRTIIGNGPLTRYFHLETAKLTAQVALLLKPLTDYLYTLPPAKNIILPTLEDQYQAIHNIIATAGYISLCIRLSPTIFYLTDVSPNDFYDPDDQYSTEQFAYSQSKQRVSDEYERDKAVWSTRGEKLRLDMQELVKRKKKTSGEGKEKAAEIEAHRRNQPMPPTRTYRALVKIGIWPNIRRYKPGSLQDEKENEKLELRDGFRIHELTKAAVVCYYGVEDRVTRAMTDVSLENFVKMKEKKWGLKQEGRLVKAAAVLGAVALPLAFSFWVSCDIAPRYEVLVGQPAIDSMWTTAAEVWSRLMAN